MGHAYSYAAEKILDKEFKVLDKGFVRLVDYMGNDDSIVQAARVSYGKNTKTVSQDRTLLRYLLRHEHTSPFEMVELKFHAKLPIFVARQWVRHRTASINEVSGRYSEMRDEFYIPSSEVIQFQSKNNKQGRSDDEVPPELREKVIDILCQGQKDAYEEYSDLLEQNIAKELSRINLPLSVYTEWYWKIDMHNLMHFLKLRMDTHAQYEIREYANTMAKMTRAVASNAYEAFQDYVLDARKFSKMELNVLKNIIDPSKITEELLETNGLKGLEAQEFMGKIEELKG